jgi:PAS domain S-box-containing protein
MSKVNIGTTLPALGPRDPELDTLSRLAVESLPSGVLVVRSDGSIAVVNRELERQFRYTRAELIGRPIEMLLPEGLRLAPEPHGAESQSTSETTAAGDIRTLVGRRRDGTQFPVEIALDPIQNEHGFFVLASVVDITPRKEIERSNSLQIDDQIAFERLVSDLSVQFINLPADRVNDAIRDALRVIGEGFDLDRCNFYRVQSDGQLTDPVSWARQGVSPAPAPVRGEESFPWALETIRAGRTMSFSRVEEIPNPIDRENFRALGILSGATIPLSVEGQLLGAVGFNTLREPRQWDRLTLHRLKVIAAAFGNVLARQKSEESLRHALVEVERLRDQLQAENLYLRREVEDRLGTGNIVGSSSAIRQVLAQVRQVAATDSTVLLLGETGTGKEIIATQLHELSGRRNRSMVRVNCAAIPTTLMESELFGRERGAFTGALSRQVGRFELADHSTIFLDEIGDLPPDVQVKLLRVLEERQIERLGSPRTIRVDTRIVAATHRNLEMRIADGTFREDLFYRLNVFPIQVPPLRERTEDIPLLVWRFVDEFSRVFGKRIEAIPRENMTALQQYAWPGNIRELRNVVERAMIVAKGSKLTISLPTVTTTAPKRSVKLTDVEKEHIRSVLESSGWRIRGSGGAADKLGLRPTTLETRMAKLGITRPKTA